MNLQAGLFIQSTSALNETLFANVTILITEHNAGGAVGFIINKPHGRSLNHLDEFRHSPYFPLYDGGPVDKEHLFFLHKRPDLIEEGTPVGRSIYSGGNFQQAVTAINNKRLSVADIKVFVGYCGWDGGELETEIEEGSWMITEGIADAVFTSVF